MRHYLLSGTITAHADRMSPATGKARLVAPGGYALGLLARLQRTVAAAVDLPAIATATDDRLAAAARTEKQPRRARLTLSQVANAP
jgi:hypothetical protein